MSFAVEPSPEISWRGDFSILCNARGYTLAIEVGTDLGSFAAQFLARFQGILLCVDDYQSYGEMPWSDRTPDMLMAIMVLAPYHGRARFIRAKSVDAAKRYQNWLGEPGFIYIDANHEYGHVMADLEAWWPVLKDGGILAGHDFDPTHPGVMRAVQEFAQARKLLVRVTHEHDIPSWYIYKGEPKTLIRRYFDSGELSNPHAQDQR